MLNFVAVKKEKVKNSKKEKLMKYINKVKAI